jgi:Ankyrin repeats (3 copies)
MVIEQGMISRKRSLVSSISIVPTPNNKRTIVTIASRLPQRLSTKKKEAPKITLEQSFMNILVSEGVAAKVVRFDTVQNYFEDPQQFEIEAYGFEALEAVRKRDIEKLKQYHAQGRPLKCSNRFGESILHLACRKGFADVVDFLLNTAQVPVWVKDDFGRNPFHDACWTVEPNFELMDILIAKAPDLLLISDARGHTPLSFVRMEHWDTWISYMNGKRLSLRPATLRFSDNGVP